MKRLINIDSPEEFEKRKTAGNHKWKFRET